jgi:hypothetical protein
MNVGLSLDGNLVEKDSSARKAAARIKKKQKSISKRTRRPKWIIPVMASAMMEENTLHSIPCAWLIKLCMVYRDTPLILF